MAVVLAAFLKVAVMYCSEFAPNELKLMSVEGVFHSEGAISFLFVLISRAVPDSCWSINVKACQNCILQLYTSNLSGVGMLVLLCLLCKCSLGLQSVLWLFYESYEDRMRPWKHWKIWGEF